MFPESVNVKQQAGIIEIVWNTGQTSTIPLMRLRQDCPCATCAQERGENPHPGLLDAPPPPKEAKKRSLSLPLLGDIRKFAIDSLHHVLNKVIFPVHLFTF